VENFFAKTGSQAVFVDGSTASQSGPWHGDSAAGPFVDLSADIAVFTAATQSAWQFAGLGPNLIQFLGGIDIVANGASSDIHAITAGNPVVGSFARATGFDPTAWHHVDLLFNMPTQTYNISLDGGLLAGNLPFCGSNGNSCTGANVAAYGSAIFDSFGGVSANDSGYIDNFSLVNRDSAVPEPTSILLHVTVLGSVGAGLRRKFSAA
jgi:hypothetical protein